MILLGKLTIFQKLQIYYFGCRKVVINNGDSSNFSGDLNAINLLEHSFQKGKEYGINCRALSITLTECLLSLGFMARTMYIMPFAPYDQDNHVVTHVYLKELKKWIMLDPTFGCYVMGKEKKPLNIFEIRELLANHEYIVFNEEIKYNDEKRMTDSWENKEYLAKDLFYFTTREKSCFNAEAEGKERYIVPLVYDVRKSKILNIEYRIKKQGNSEWIQSWLKNAKESNILYMSPSDVLKKP